MMSRQRSQVLAQFWFHILRGRRFIGHFHLNGRNRDSGCFRVVIPGQINTAGSKTATNIKNPAARRNSRGLREMLDELNLSLFLGFVATNPVAMMQMLPP